jgi:hypothetical protein
MNKHLILGFFLLQAAWTFGQQSFGGIGPSWTTTRFTPGLLNDMVTSYNTYFSNNMEQPLEPFSSTMTGLTYALYTGFRIEGIFIGMQGQRTQFTQTRESFFNNGYGREYRLRFADLAMMADFGFSVKKLLDVGGSFGGGLRFVEVRSMQLYPNGIRSIGNEYYFNGVYTNSEGTLLYGAFMNVRPIKHITLQARLFRNVPGFGTSSYEDLALTALEDGNTWDKNLYTTILPYDFEKYVQDVSNGVKDPYENVIPASFPGWNLSFTAFINLNFGAKD